jgi:hypothetical protein
MTGIDTVALADFIAGTAFVFAYQIAGAVIAFSILLELILFFKNIWNRRSFIND